MDASVLAIRTSLVNSLPDDGNRCMACLAQAGIRLRQQLAGIICFSTDSQCRMVASLFWTEKSNGRHIGYRSFVGGYSGNAHFLLENLPCCRSSPGTVLAMGQLRHGTQFFHLEAEPMIALPF